MIIFAVIYSKRLLAANAKLDKRATHLEEHLAECFDYATLVQNAVLPSRDDIKKIFPRHFLIYKPVNIVGGDFYWFRKIDNLRIGVVADATGRGVPGAIMTMLGSMLIERVVGKTHHPDEMLNEIRREVIHLLHQDSDQKEEKLDGFDMAIFVVDDATNILEFAGANMQLIHIHNFQVSEFKGDRMSLCYSHRAGQPFTRHGIEFMEGDLIYTFTNGYGNQYNPLLARRMLSKNLKDIIVENQRKAMTEQKSIISQRFVDWQGTAEQTDDVLVFGTEL